MLPAYDETWKYNHSEKYLQDYIERTTIADHPNDVKERINEFMQYTAAFNAKEVRKLLMSIISDDKLLNKTTVVRDASYRNAVILVYPDIISYITVGKDCANLSRNEKNEICQRRC